MNERTFEEVLREDGFLCWKNVGVSMLPVIKQGKDIIVIKSLYRPLKKFDIVLFVRPNTKQYVLHRIIKVNPDGTFFIVGDNCISGELIHKNDIIGILTSVSRNGKALNTNGFFYKLYLAFWCSPYRFRFFVLKFFGKLKYIIKRLKK